MAGTHAKLSPSGAKRMHACPGASVLLETIPPEQREESGQAARLGTAAHFLLEKSLSEQYHPEEYRDRIIELLGDLEDGSMLRKGAKLPVKDLARMKRSFIVDDDMIRGVGMAYEYVMDRCAELSFDPAKLKLEVRTNPVPERDDTSGTADVTIDAWPDLLEVVDYKNGYNTVEHVDNPQLLAYLAGMAHDTQWAHDNYRITVVQPNGAHDEGRIRPFDVTRDELEAFVAQHRAAAERVDQAAEAWSGDQTSPMQEGTQAETWADAFLHPGDHCDMCECSFICTAKKAWVKEQAGVDFDDDPFEAELPALDSLAEAVKVFRFSKRLKAHINMATKMVREAMLAGQKPPGVKAIRGNNKGAWKPDLGPPERVAEMLVEEGFISDNERALIFEPVSLLTGPKVEKLIKAKDKVPGTVRKREFRSKFMTSTPGAIRMVLEEEPGDPVELNPGDGFDDDPFGD